MVHWYHAIFSAYGYWLPNDPRGSWSDFVASYELHHFGPATKTDQSRSLAHDAHDHRLRVAGKTALKYPPVRFDAAIRKAIAIGFAEACAEFEITLHACAIGHDHVHAIAGRSQRTIEQMVAVLKARATRQLGREGLHPLKEYRDTKRAVPTPWSEGCWKVFINDVQQLRQAIQYVKRHPMKEGLPAQDWSFLRPV